MSDADDVPVDSDRREQDRSKQQGRAVLGQHGAPASAGEVVARPDRPVVRRARARDLDGLADLHYRNWCDTYLPLIPAELHDSITLGDRVAFWTQALARCGLDASAWAAIAGREIVGLAYGYPAEADPTRVGFVDALHVATPWRRHGLARTLLELTLHDFRRRGLESAELLVVAGNPAATFYEYLGWSAMKRSRAPLDRGLPEVELVRYSRAL